MHATNRYFPKIITAVVVLSTIILSSCNTSGNDSSLDLDSEWLIPASQIVDGGPGKDGIPSLDNPDFIDLSEATFIPDDRMVLGLRVGDEIMAYPHQVLDWHEIVNDEADGKSVAVLFCPLTGTGMAWNRNINGTITEFGVSGLLFKNNLIPYDRSTDSNWSQMLQQSVNGTLSGLQTSVYPVVETSWATWKELYPDSRVPTDVDDCLAVAADLFEAFARTGLPQERLIIDPVVAPLIWDDGLRHNRAILDVIPIIITKIIIIIIIIRIMLMQIVLLL